MPQLASRRNCDGPSRQRLLDLDFARDREGLLTDALACHLETLGDRPASREAIHKLALADRHALVRTLLLAQGGCDLAVTATCPGGHRLDLMLDLAAIAVPELSEPITLRRRVGGVEVSQPMRCPRPEDVAAARDSLDVVARCTNLSRQDARAWRRAAERAMAKADPLAEIEVVGACAECGARAAAECDLVGVWLHRLRRQAGELLEQIHALAVHYHWSERAILALPDARRNLYLDLCWQQTAAGPASFHAD
jgi:hypothetical protein